jgi:type IV pilus assembly protein PilW
MRTTLPFSRTRRGFTLIELLVAMALGMLTTVIIAEVMLKSEGNRRTTTEGSDAQLNGALALYTLQRDIAMAGYGIISTNSVLGCEVRGKYGSNTMHSFTLAPVKITFGGSPTASDTITILRSGSSSGYAIPLTTTAIHNSSDSSFVVQSSMGVKAGDLMLVMPATPDATHWCTMFTVNASAGSALTDTTVPNVTAANSWNPGTSIMPASYAGGSSLAKISQLVYRQYAVTNNNLVATDLFNDTDQSSTNTVGPQVVLVKAYYGKDNNGDGQVDAYDTNTPATTADWKKVMTIRIAVVTRSAQPEKVDALHPAPTTTNPVWDVGTTVAPADAVSCGSRKCVTLQVSPATGSDTTWQQYRYKVFDTVIPLRNMLWTS